MASEDAATTFSTMGLLIGSDMMAPEAYLILSSPNAGVAKQ